MEMTLLERLDQLGTMAFNTELKLQELRRSLAIAQAVEEDIEWAGAIGDMDKEKLMRRADELLKEKP